MTMGPRNSNQISMMGLRYSLYPVITIINSDNKNIPKGRVSIDSN